MTARDKANAALDALLRLGGTFKLEITRHGPNTRIVRETVTAAVVAYARKATVGHEWWCINGAGLLPSEPTLGFASTDRGIVEIAQRLLEKLYERNSSRA